MNDRVGALVCSQDWPALQSLYASFTDAQWRELITMIAFDEGFTIAGWMLSNDSPLAVWNPVTTAAGRLGLQMLTQTDSYGCIPLHWALQYCRVLAVVAFVIANTPPTMLHHKNNAGYTPLAVLAYRFSSRANTVEIRALFQSALRVSVCVLCCVAVPTCRQPPTSLAARPDIVAALFTHQPPP